MPVELRKRKAPEQAAPTPVQTKKKGKAAAAVEAAVEKVKEVVVPKEKAATKTNGAAAKTAKDGAPEPGTIIDINDFGGEIETHEGDKTSLKKLLEESKSGVVLFTYPKASTPGCITQACLFRDSYVPLTSTGLSIYGLSRDSLKANTGFVTKQNLPYTLLCDNKATLISAIGFKKGPAGTVRGVIVISKEGKVLARSAGNPAKTVEIVQELVKSESLDEAGTGVEDVEKAQVAAEVAAEVADDPEKIDGEEGVTDGAGDKVGIDEAAEKKDEEEKVDVAAEVVDTAETLDDK